ncbi:MAG TPA: hypothetical protein VKY41_02075, partial [Xanthomarina sp.]|nr:hypothetical protein [Xanthomarina sp.]
YVTLRGRFPSVRFLFHFFLDKKTKQKNQWNSKANAAHREISCAATPWFLSGMLYFSYEKSNSA